MTISELIDCQIELTAERDARVLRRGRRSKTKPTALAPLRQSTSWILLRLLFIMRIFTQKTLWATRLKLAVRVFIFWERQFLIGAPAPSAVSTLCV